ncbi:MAG: ATP-binding protein [Planctomycetes bacterium]|nr:ATP-binding protein [Planctomycetota bacterium]
MSDFFIGFDRHPETPPAEGEPAPSLHLKPDTLLRHMMALGSSGSGKTVLCKVLTEEMVRNGLPAICIDPQGDLCSLAMNADNPEFLREKGIDPEMAAQFAATVDPVIFTPASRKGIALSADPMAIDVDALKPRDRVYAITSIATMVVSLLGYDLDSDDGAGLVAVFDRALTRLQKTNAFPRNLDQFTGWLLNLDDATKEEFGRYLDVKKIEHACQKLARLDVGARRLLFHEGLALDIELLLGLGDRSAAEDGKTRLSVIYLNTLNSQEDKEFFVAALVERLYTWMLRNPSKEPQAMFYIDEVAPFIPPVRKPACKPALSLLFKQARKYGVCCLMATQNPADVDYKAMAQFGTWAIGRLTTRQDMKKVEPTVKALDPVNVDAIMEELPAQKPGQFVLISPDNFEHTHRLQCRWLYTKHETLDDERIEHLMDLPYEPLEPDPDAVPITIRERFEELEHDLVVRELEETEVPEPADDDDEPLPEEEDEELEEELPPDTPRSGPSSTATLQTDPEIEECDRVLAKAASMSTKEFAARAGLGESAARGRLARLYAAKRAKRFKQGRENRYYSLSTGLRPDLGLDRRVSVIVSRVTSNDAERAAREVRRTSSLFGLIGDDEELDHAELDHRLVIQLGFTEKVTRMFLKRIFGGRRHDEMLDSVYLHPENLKIVIFDPEGGIRLEERPEEYASRIVDFDGAVTFEEMRPGEVRLHEPEIKKRKSDEVIKESFKRRFRATPKRIQPVFLPVWNLHLKSSTRPSTRVVVIDALVGKPLDW